MIKPPIPENEAARLRELRSYHILDTPSEQEYDDIALLASQICGAPIALISLIDGERQWFKSKIGLEIEETSRDAAFCAYAVMPNSPRPFIVEDATKDERFVDNPLVTGNPNIRFYAGAPLVTTDNHAIGTLCVIDRKPRQLDDAQLQALQALARQLTMKLELRRMSVLLQESNKKLQNLSLTDDLTGLYNRRGFLFHAEQQLKLFRSRRSDSGLWLMMADMDKLKPINDEFGHEEGSAAIAKTAEIFCRTFRDADIIARLGGDEFAVLIINAVKNSDRIIAERLQHNFDDYNNNSGKPYRLMASFGIVEIDFDTETHIEEIIRQADKTMYEHKRSRKSSTGNLQQL